MTHQEVSVRALVREDAPVIAELLHGLLNELSSEEGPSLEAPRSTANRGDTFAERVGSPVIMVVPAR